MSARVTATEGVCAIYDSVTQLPLMTEVFDDEDVAEEFIQFVQRKTNNDIRQLPQEELAGLRREFLSPLA